MEYVVSKRGSLTRLVVGLNLALFLFAIALIGVSIPYWFTPNNLPLSGVLVAFVGAGITLRNLILFLNQHIAVNTSFLTNKNLFGTSEFPFSKCTEVLLMPTYGTLVFLGRNLFLRFQVTPTVEKRAVVYTNVYANRDELVMAIIEAAHTSNPNVKIEPKLLDDYGSPPYGIFGPKERVE